VPECRKHHQQSSQPPATFADTGLIGDKPQQLTFSTCFQPFIQGQQPFVTMVNRLITKVFRYHSRFSHPANRISVFNHPSLQGYTGAWGKPGSTPNHRQKETKVRIYLF
jgi:hypothetical protein